jgi:cytoskeletal protein CcmA (bactofilin family)
MGIFNSKRKSNRAEGGKTIIAQGCLITGEITDLKGPLHIDGKVEGVIDSEFDVSIGHSGQVTGVIKARNIALSGCLDGEINCQKIEILSTGKLIGDLICVDFTVEAGGKFIGQSHELTEEGMIVSLKDESSQLESDGNPKVLTHEKEMEEAIIIEETDAKSK